MDIDITIKNYRSFQQPVTIQMRKGFTSFIGINNSGKSSLLKFFYEFRRLFNEIDTHSSKMQTASFGNMNTAPPLNGISDTSDIFCNENERDIEIDVELQNHCLDFY